MASRLSHEEFFNSLSTLLTTTTQKTSGSVFLTQKPLLHSESANTASSTDHADESRPPILIRATDGKTGNPNPKSKDGAGKQKESKQEKLKLSTVVDQGDLEAFYARYAEVCKGGMTGMKKRDRKKGRAKKGGAAKVTKS
ncbi:hypothetical protein PHISP_05508 [Aspergillus sp. HF37]|nr:hypothetical protein PHISP_05508 [Aspergillus sp. HF37]